MILIDLFFYDNNFVNHLTVYFGSLIKAHRYAGRSDSFMTIQKLLSRIIFFGSNGIQREAIMTA